MGQIKVWVTTFYFEILTLPCVPINVVWIQVPRTCSPAFVESQSSLPLNGFPQDCSAAHLNLHWDPTLSPPQHHQGPSRGRVILEVSSPCSCSGRILEPCLVSSFPQYLTSSHREILLDLPSKYAQNLPASHCPLASILLPVLILSLRDFSCSFLLVFLLPP